MDYISKVFDQSLKLLKEHKIIIAPFIASILFSFIIFAIGIQATGFGSVMQEFTQLQNEYNEIQGREMASQIGIENEFLQGIFAGMANEQRRNDPGLDEYLTENGWDDSKFMDLMTLQNLYIAVILIVLSIIGQIYLACLSYTVAVKKMKRQVGPWGEALRRILAYIGAGILVSLILVVAPLIVMVLLAVLFFAIHPILGGLMLLLLMLAFLAYLLYFGIRLYFVMPAIFFDRKGPSNAIGDSWRMSKASFKKTAIAFLISTAIVWVITMFTNDAVGNSFWNVNMSFNIGYLFLFLVLVIVQGIVLGFQTIFNLHAYSEAKKW